jgi:flavoprotein
VDAKNVRILRELEGITVLDNPQRISGVVAKPMQKLKY